MSREHYHSPVSRRACDQGDFIGQVLSPILVTRSRFAWKSYRMLSHVHIGVSNFERALAFYRSLMDELGFTLKFVELEKPWAGWMQPGRERPLFLVGRPYNGEDANPGNGQMVALLAAGRDVVDRAYARAIAAGARSDGEPGLSPHYHPHYYGAYFARQRAVSARSAPGAPAPRNRGSIPGP
jgi:catechol 2,3-dioxygenase-like lactoylglutathione lyase family enzyme